MATRKKLRKKLRSSRKKIRRKARRIPTKTAHSKNRGLLTQRLSARRLAAVDVGSNAIRMILAEQDASGIHILERFRFPIRLGADVFDREKISDKNIHLAAVIFKDFAELLEKFHVRSLLAVGTSALREAKNRGRFLQSVHKASGIHIRIIDGVEEARLIHQAVKHQISLNRQRALLIDIGGGSVELTFSERAMMSATESFPFGTVRTLEYMKRYKLNEEGLEGIADEYLRPMTDFISRRTRRQRPRIAVGTGGNVETLARLKSRLLNSNDQEVIEIAELEEMIARLQAYKIKDRIRKLNMRPDRADVIVPAALVLHSAMKKAQLRRILVPHVGLREGLLWRQVSK